MKWLIKRTKANAFMKIPFIVFRSVYVVLGFIFYTTTFAQEVIIVKDNETLNVNATTYLSRDAFTMSYPEGLTDYIVLETKGLTIKDEFLRTLEWIKRTYNTQVDVIKSKTENENIRIQGFAKNVYSLESIGGKTSYDIRYQIEFFFKDGKIKFSLLELEAFYPPSQSSTGGWSPLGAASLYEADGTERPMAKQGWEDVISYLNELANDVKQFVLNPSYPGKRDR